MRRGVCWTNAVRPSLAPTLPRGTWFRRGVPQWAARGSCRARCRMGVSTTVAIIGAGPYGLAMAAHLRAQGTDFRIFGVPLQSWRAQMPKGMFLKSEGFASNLHDP